MKRALALLEQTKNTMPHLPRPTSGKDSDSGSDNETSSNSKKLDRGSSSLQYQKSQRRNPSAHGKARILGSASSNNNENAKHNNINTNTNMGGTEMSSRKSTAVSSSTRVGSSGALNNNSTSARNAKKTSFTGTGSFNAADIIEKEKQQPVYELSLKPSNNNKKPHKLKPLSSAKLNTDNKATSILEIENAYQKEIMNDIEKDLTDYLDTNQIFSQMQNAFGGSATVITNSSSLIKSNNEAKQKKKSSALGKTMITGSQQLDPILEENVSMGQLVAYQPNMSLQEQRAKKNEALKKKVKLVTGGGVSDSSSTLSITSGPVMQSNETDTFITGTKVANKDYDGELAVPEMDENMLREYETHMQQRKKKYYKYEEDELLDELDQHEKDMNDMLKYLSEVEDLIKGQDLKSIQQMMDVTKDTMTQHFQACDKFKGQILEIDTQAEAAIKVLNFYESDGKNVDGYKKNSAAGTQLQRVIEDMDEAELMNNKKNKPSHEQSKSTIVNKLYGMNQSIRDFTSDLESRLDRAYKSGATKKFGYDGLTTASQLTAFEDGKKEERSLNKIANQAQQFIEQNSASAMLKSSTPSSYQSTYARKNSNNGIKAIASSEMISSTTSQKRKSSVKAMRPKIMAGTNKSTALNTDLANY
eukprot:403351287